MKRKKAHQATREIVQIEGGRQPVSLLDTLRRKVAKEEANVLHRKTM